MNRNAFPWTQLIPSALAGLFAGILIVAWFRSLALPAQLPESPPVFDAHTQAARRQFNADAAIMIKFVRPEMTAQYEASLARVREALDRSLTPTRRQQARGWRVFRAVQTATNGDRVYVFEIDPPVNGADYAVSKLLVEAFAEEGEAVYRRYAESYSGPQNILDLELVEAFGQRVAAQR